MEIADKPHLATHGGHRFSEDCAFSKRAEANAMRPTSKLNRPGWGGILSNRDIMSIIILLSNVAQNTENRQAVS
jgi:hypothetical protein